MSRGERRRRRATHGERLGWRARPPATPPWARAVGTVGDGLLLAWGVSRGEGNNNGEG